MLKKEYSSRKKDFEIILKGRKRVEWKISFLRLLLIILAVYFAYLSVSTGHRGFLILSIASFACFLWALKKHQSLRRQILRLRGLMEINENEISYLDNELSAFDDGSEFIDPSHLFSNDLDLFGKHSLFAHLNRTATLYGKKKLAKAIKTTNSQNLKNKQEAIHELSDKMDWRQNFAVSGREVKENPYLQSSLNQWLAENHKKNTWLLSPWILYPFAAIAIFLLCYWFYDTTFQHFKWFLWAFAFNILLVFTQFKKIKSEAAQLYDISASLEMYSDLLLQVESLEVKSDLLKSLQSKVKSSNQTASTSLKKLSRILNGFNQLSNPVAMIVTNGLYHFHLHVLGQLYNWKEHHGIDISSWIDVIGEFDHLNSIANYVYNHPTFCMPEISEKVEFSAKEMGHPQLNPQKRVDNDLSFDDHRFVVLTGSNMSGKSTFLRAVGVNLVLMKIGSTVCADNFTAYPFNILTSMRQVDSLDKDESYFQAEVIRLKRIQEVLNSGEACFVLLDEILRGTNSDDKRKGTALFMEKIAHSNALGIIATHDIDIADLAQKQPAVFSANYFESKVKDGELTFDYTFRKGICTTPNAIELMKAQGII